MGFNDFNIRFTVRIALPQFGKQFRKTLEDTGNSEHDRALISKSRHQMGFSRTRGAHQHHSLEKFVIRSLQIQSMEKIR